MWRVLLLSVLGLMACVQNQGFVATPATSPVAMPLHNSLDGNEEQAILSYHNQVRSSVGVAPLHWANDLALHAAHWAEVLESKSCQLEHSHDSSYGENLFMTSNKDTHQAVVEAARAWEGEKSSYSGQALNQSNWSDAGHYTQMVWSSTTELGCAKALCSNGVLVVCNYHPAGNRLGEKPY